MLNQILTLQVIQRSDEAEGVIRLVLADPQGRDLPSWQPGAHIDVFVDEAGHETLIRQYSLSGSARDDKNYEITVLREASGSGGSLAIHEQLRLGKLVRVSEPRNHFELQPSGHYIFVAGGIGITPILAMIKEAQDVGISWELHYAGRALETMAYHEWLSAQKGTVILYPKGISAALSIDDVIAKLDGTNDIYACGPSRLLAELEEKVPSHYSDSLHLERFVNDTIVSTDLDQPFAVELALSGKTVTVNPGESILEVVSRAGVNVPSSCRGGTCGTCETFVLSGDVDHRDAVLTAKEREESEVMMICVSRCKGKFLSLEL